jgi:hypothetical protein
MDAKTCHVVAPTAPAEHFHQNSLFQLARSAPQHVRHVVMLYLPQRSSPGNAPLQVVEGSHLFSALGVEVRLRPNLAARAHGVRHIRPGRHRMSSLLHLQLHEITAVSLTLRALGLRTLT